MTSSKSTKRALISSALAILVCVAMLIGTTFAWFTDTASTAVNKIQAGNLKVDIIGENSEAHVDMLNFTKAAGAEEGEQLLWEPGCRYLTEGFRITNKGNLALKWKAQVNKGTTAANEGNFDLLDVIDFYLVTSKDVDDMGTALDEFSGKLKKSETSGAYYIKGVMKTTAGNDYQGLTLDGITITVVATQDTVENDSFNDQYDKDATYSVANVADLAAALGKDGIVNVVEDLNPAEAVVSTANTTLNMGGKTVANTNDVWDVTPNSWSLVSARAGELTIEGDGTFKAKENDCYAVDVQDGAKVVIKDGTFIGNIHAVYVLKGELVVEGGFFSVQQKYPDAAKADEFVLNCYDANRAAGTAKITVKGGTYVNFNPADCMAEGANTNFVADGYMVVAKKQANGDVWYTVVEASAVKETLTAGGEVTVDSDTYTNNSADTAEARLTITVPTTLNLNAKIVTPDGMGNNNTNFCALIVDADTTINATENGGIDTGTNGGYGINVRNGATLTINGGNYYGGGTAVQVQKGTLIINGGTFACEPYSNPVYGSKYLINCIDAAYKDGSAKIIIKGGTFINFDPSDSASENPHGNFVAAGYHVVSAAQANGDVWYTVVAD